MLRCCNASVRGANLSRRIWQTTCRMSTAWSRLACSVAMAVAMKQPLRPMPALQCTTTGPRVLPLDASTRCVFTILTSSSRLRAVLGALWSGHVMYQ